MSSHVILAPACLGLAATLVATAPSPAAAHPHVWVKVEATVLYEKGTIVGLAQRWTFDEMYTAMAIQGLDTNNDGTYDRQELAELAQVNIDGLKEFDYFTFPMLGGTNLAIEAPKDYWLEHKNGELALHVTMTLAQPVLAEATGFTFSVYDPSFFIAFDFAGDTAVKLAGAPAGCKASLVVPKADADLAKALADAAQVDATGSVGADLGFAVAKSVTLDCPKT